MIVPEVPTVMLLEKLALELVETSNPVGAMTFIAAVMFAPDTVKLVASDGVPAVVLSWIGPPCMAISGLFADALINLIAPVFDIETVAT